MRCTLKTIWTWWSNPLAGASRWSVLAACIALSYIALLPHFYLIFNASNRHFLLWDHAYHAAIVTAVLLLALIYFAAILGGSAILRNFPRLGAWVVSVLVLAILIRSGIAMMDRLDRLPDVLAPARNRIVLYLLLPMLLALPRPLGLARLVRNALLCATPLPAFLLLVPLTYTTFDKGDLRSLNDMLHSEDIHAEANGNEPNVLVFIFDEWSYDRAFGPGSEDLMPFAHQMAERSLFFENAFSAGATTKTAIPRMLLPFSDHVRGQPYQVLADRVDGRRLQADSDSIFELVPEHYLKVVSGFWFDYEQLMADDVDYAASYNDGAPYFRTYQSEVARLLRTQLDWLRLFGYRQPYIPRIGWLVAQQMVHEDALFVLRHARQPLMAVFHYCLPHYPYAWTEAGQKVPLPEDVNEHTVENYKGNMAYLDRVINEVMDVLDEKGTGNDLVILTSDHAWRVDPDRAEWSELADYPNAEIDTNPESPFRHVPLLVHAPSTTPPGRVESPFNLADVHRLIESHMADTSVVDPSQIR